MRKYLHAVIILLLIAGVSSAAQNARAKNISALFMKRNPKLTAKTADSYSAIIFEAAEKFKQDPYVIAAVIVHESTVNNRAVSKGGDYGLMQVRWKVHEKAIKKKFPRVKKASDMFDARTNIFFGTEILADCMKKANNDTRGGILKYSAGNEKLANKVLATVKELQSKDKTTTKTKTKTLQRQRKGK